MKDLDARFEILIDEEIEACFAHEHIRDACCEVIKEMYPDKKVTSKNMPKEVKTIADAEDILCATADLSSHLGHQPWLIGIGAGIKDKNNVIVLYLKKSGTAKLKLLDKDLITKGWRGYPVVIKITTQPKPWPYYPPKK